MNDTARCLQALIDWGGPLTARDVADETGIKIGHVSRALVIWRKRKKIKIVGEFAPNTEGIHGKRYLYEVV